MAEDAALLRRVSAELRAERERVGRTVQEIDDARARFGSSAPSRLELYGAAALLDTFYTGVEKAFTRVAAALGGLPEGPSWHRTPQS